MASQQRLNQFIKAGCLQQLDKGAVGQAFETENKHVQHNLLKCSKQSLAGRILVEPDSFVRQLKAAVHEHRTLTAQLKHMLGSSGKAGMAAQRIFTLSYEAIQIDREGASVHVSVHASW